jgi:isopentenyl-diphosphate delta-isomerase
MSIADRKADHIDLCATGPVGFRDKRTLLADVELLHDALPELDVDAIDTRTTLFGKTLRAPILIAAMTGGTPRAATINRQLAAIAEELGYGFGLGSQRPMLDDPDDPSYQVREVAPTCLLLGNLGAVQARKVGVECVETLAAAVGADAMCLHLNPAMELIQSDGDRDFRGIVETLTRCAETLPIPVVAKETGCGISPQTAARLAGCGVCHVDVSGAGGTSWVAVETERAEAEARSLGEALREWGIPTAASVVYARRTEPGFDSIIATGGIGTGLDIARAIALGASAAGMARPVLKALERGGTDEVRKLLAGVERELRSVMLLVGAANIEELSLAPYIVRGELRDWLSSPTSRPSPP